MGDIFRRYVGAMYDGMPEWPEPPEFDLYVMDPQRMPHPYEDDPE